MPDQTAVAEARTHIGSGRVAEAARTLWTASRKNDAAALAELAQWSIAGNIIPRDLAAARSFLAQAANAGDHNAALLLASFLASGTAGALEWRKALAILRGLAPHVARAREQIALLDAMNVDDDGAPRSLPSLRKLSEHPCVETCPKLLTVSEARYLAATATPHLQPALVVDEATGRMIAHPVRDSDGAMFGVHLEDLVVSTLNRRIAGLTNTRYGQGEPLQLLRYHNGGQYRPHMDALPSNEPNQRIMTVILYLNDDYAGGETVFPRTGLSIRGKLGDALVFRNANSSDQPDPLSLHAGAPVTAGTKLIATRWIRRNPFSYPPPKPLLSGIPK